MNSSAQQSRRIASNLLWTAQGFIRNALITVAPDGRVLSVATCDAPDREACVEFYAGVLVPGFPADYQIAFNRMMTKQDHLLEELLGEQAARLPAETETVLVVISGLDYAAMRLTEASCIRRIL